jgi:hypothetical protein
MAQLAIPAILFVASAWKGKQEKKEKYRESEAYLEAADRRMAAMTRDVAEEERNKAYMYSRALAVSAASGAGIDVPTVVNALGDLNAEGDYRILSAMYVGSQEAGEYQYASEAARREGDAAQTAGIINGVTSALTYGYGAGWFGGGSPAPTSTMPKKTSKVGIPA